VFGLKVLAPLAKNRHSTYYRPHTSDFATLVGHHAYAARAFSTTSQVTRHSFAARDCAKLDQTFLAQCEETYRSFSSLIEESNRKPMKKKILPLSSLEARF
jgi:hypothetical protein